MYSHLHGISVGSGTHYAEGWYNTDITIPHTGKAPDLLIDIYDMPSHFPHHTFERAYVGHVLEHIEYGEPLTNAIQSIAYIAKTVMVVGPCMKKAIATNQPDFLLRQIEMNPNHKDDPGEHKWTPTEELTAEAIRDAGYEPNIVDVYIVRKPEWPNPDNSPWQTAMWFRS